MYLFVIGLAALFTTVAVGFYVKPTQGPGYNEQCYTCPRASPFKTGTFSSEEAGYAKLQPGNPFQCSYWTQLSPYKDGNNVWKSQDPQFLGICRYLVDGRPASGNRDECYRWAGTDAKCKETQEHNKDKGTYLKKCDQKGCGYETVACYTCPKLGSDYVQIDTSGKELGCAYHSGGKEIGYCAYNSSTGNVAFTEFITTCPTKAPQDIPCLEKLEKEQAEKSFQARYKKYEDDKKKEAAEKEKFLKEKGFWAVGCTDAIMHLFPDRDISILDFGVKDRAEICRWKPEKLLEKLRALQKGLKSRLSTRPESLKSPGERRLDAKYERIKDYADGLEATIKKTS